MKAWIPAVLVLLAGCTTPDAGPGEAAPAPTWSQASVTLNLTAAGTLTPDAVPDGVVPLAWGYADWLSDVPPPSWHGQEASTPWRIIEGTLILHYQATAPQTGADARPELTAWFGSQHSMVHHLFMDGPDATMPGQALRGEAELRLPLGGMVYDQGDHPVLAVGSYYLDNAAQATMDLLVGGDDPSRLELLIEPVSLPVVDASTATSNTATLAGGRCVADVNPNDVATATFRLDIEDDRMVRLRLAPVVGGPTPDVDFAVQNAAGDTVSRGQSSLSTEGIDLYAPNLAAAGPGPYTVIVYACTAQVVQVTISIEAA